MVRADSQPQAGTGAQDRQLADVDRAITDFSQTIAVNPKDSVAYRNRGLQYGRKGEYKRAIQDFDQAILFNPADGRAHGFRALAWQRLGDHGRAITDFYRAIELDPDNATTYASHQQKSISEVGGVDKPPERKVPPPGAFNLLANPFVLLGLQSNATAQDVKDACEDAIEDGIASEEDVRRAQQILLTPKLRLHAEISGLLDVELGLASQIVTELKRGADAKGVAQGLLSLHSLARSNVMAHLAACFGTDVGGLTRLLEAQATTAVGAVCDAINDAREEAGSGRTDRQAVADTLVKLREEQIKAVVEKFVGGRDFAEQFATFVKSVLSKSDANEIGALDLYVRAYGQAVAAELSRKREKVTEACNAVRADPKNKGAVSQIADTLHAWNVIALPAQLYEAHLNREEAQAKELYLQVRDLCLWLANENDEYEIARTITNACADVFENLPRSIGQMKEEQEILKRLQNEKDAVALLGPLIKLCGETKEIHRKLESDLLKNGFGPFSTGIAGTLFAEFSKGVDATKRSEFSDAPWRLIRQIAIELNNDSQAPKAAAAIIAGLVRYMDGHRPSNEVVQQLEQDQRAAEKNVVQSELEQNVRAGRWKSAIPLIDRLLNLETEADELGALRNMRETLASKRRSQVISRWGWGIAAVVIIGLIAANQDDKPKYATPRYSSPQSYNPNQQYSPPNKYSSAPRPLAQPSPSTPNEQFRSKVPNAAPAQQSIVRPPVGSDLNFTQANLRYCLFDQVIMEAERALIVTDSQRLAFNASIDDWNSRCSRYRYLKSDDSVVRAEIPGRTPSLQAKARQFADTWASTPAFTKTGLTVSAPDGRVRSTFTVDLALTPKEWSWGTSFRATMPANAGVLYIYPTPKMLSQTMLTAYFSLDVLFIDEQGKVVEIFKRRPARSSDPVSSKGPLKAMLELNAGAVDLANIQVGDALHTFKLSDTTAGNN